MKASRLKIKIKILSNIYTSHYLNHKKKKTFKRKDPIEFMHYLFQNQLNFSNLQSSNLMFLHS